MTLMFTKRTPVPAGREEFLKRGPAPGPVKGISADAVRGFF